MSVTIIGNVQSMLIVLENGLLSKIVEPYYKEPVTLVEKEIIKSEHKEIPILLEKTDSLHSIASKFFEVDTKYELSQVVENGVRRITLVTGHIPKSLLRVTYSAGNTHIFTIQDAKNDNGNVYHKDGLVIVPLTKAKIENFSNEVNITFQGTIDLLIQAKPSYDIFPTVFLVEPHMIFEAAIISSAISTEKYLPILSVTEDKISLITKMLKEFGQERVMLLHSNGEELAKLLKKENLDVQHVQYQNLNELGYRIWEEFGSGVPCKKFVIPKNKEILPFALLLARKNGKILEINSSDGSTKLFDPIDIENEIVVFEDYDMSSIIATNYAFYQKAGLYRVVIPKTFEKEIWEKGQIVKRLVITMEELDCLEYLLKFIEQLNIYPETLNLLKNKPTLKFLLNKCMNRFTELSIFSDLKDLNYGLLSQLKQKKEKERINHENDLESYSKTFEKFLTNSFKNNNVAVTDIIENNEVPITIFTKGFPYTLIKNNDGYWGSQIPLGMIPNEKADLIILREFLSGTRIRNPAGLALIVSTFQQTESTILMEKLLGSLIYPISYFMKLANSTNVISSLYTLPLDLVYFDVHGGEDSLLLADRQLNKEEIQKIGLINPSIILSNSHFAFQK